jgi:hypothetical protein
VGHKIRNTRNWLRANANYIIKMRSKGQTGQTSMFLMTSKQWNKNNLDNNKVKIMIIMIVCELKKSQN